MSSPWPVRSCLAVAAALALAGCGPSGEASPPSEASSGPTHTTVATATTADPTPSAGTASARTEDAGHGVYSITASGGEREVDGSAYDPGVRQQRERQLEDLKDDGSHSAEDPLLVLDPFGTSTTSLYTYFETPDPGTLEYTVASPGTEDFTRTALDHGGDDAVETQMIGLVPGAENTVTLTFTPDDGDPQEHEVTVRAPAAQADVPLNPKRTEAAAPDRLSDGLFVLAGAEDSQGITTLVDNHGTLRGELVGDDYRADRIETWDGDLVLPVSESEIARVDGLGRVREVHHLDGVLMHHDFRITEDGSLYTLTSKAGGDSIEDMVTALDLTTGEQRTAADLGDLLPRYKELAVPWSIGTWAEDPKAPLDWLHLNSIDLLDEGTALLSSRETSSVLKVSGLDTDSPSVERIMGPRALWEGTGYEDKVLERKDPHPAFAGQHAVVAHQDDSLEEGQYYVSMFDNNFWRVVSRPDYQGPAPEGSGTDHDPEPGTRSHAQRYLVDESAGTYELVDSWDVDYSSIVSSVQSVGDSVVVNSGMAQTFTEFDRAGQALATFTYDAERYAYRALKYDFQDVWFSRS